MISTTVMSLDDYWQFQTQDNTDTRYELEDGVLRVMPPESELNRRIAVFLLVYFAQHGLPSPQLTMKTEVTVSGARATVRVPDLLVLSEELVLALEGANQSTITSDMPPPLVAIEVVSPGKKNEERDYRYKRSQYQARGISEYWIVDPTQQKVTILTLVDGIYEEQIFTENVLISSPFLEQLTPLPNLTVRDVLGG